MTSQEIISLLRNAGDEKQAAHLRRFFKTGPGEYGEGDCFLGVRVPQTRAIVRRFKGRTTTEDVEILTASRFHEVRLAGFLSLIDIFEAEKRRKSDCRSVVDFYLSLLDRGNNWDLVDLVAPKILGSYLVAHPEERHLLRELAQMEGKLWHQRTAMVSCWKLIQQGEFADALELCEYFLPHTHDLIHKASGWMLREIGKRGGYPELIDFLDRHAVQMPRTMLRYSLEKLSPELRAHYMAKR